MTTTTYPTLVTSGAVSKASGDGLRCNECGWLNTQIIECLKCGIWFCVDCWTREAKDEHGENCDY